MRRLLGQRLHLVIQILLLIDVQVLIRLIYDCLRDASRAALLLVVVQGCVDPALLACPHV